MYITKKHMIKSFNWKPEEIEKYVERARKEDLQDIKLFRKKFVKNFVKGMFTSPKITLRLIYKKYRNVV
jgi:hypothetical protein